MATPWEIGRAHWNQRDLYTKNASIEDDGYGAGPTFHPEVGSFAYHRPPVMRPAKGPPSAELYGREAWPWRFYEGQDTKAPRKREGVLTRFFDRIVSALVGRSRDTEIADERLAADVRGALAARRDVDVRDIHVHARDGEITLTGSVPSRLMKDRAAETTRSTNGVLGVHDKLHVRSDDDVLFLMPLQLFAT